MEKPKRTLKIDLAELAYALESGDDEISHYLDLETGEVVEVTDESRAGVEALLEELDEDAPPKQILDVIESLDEQDWQKEAYREAALVEMEFGVRFLTIPQVDLHEAYRDMEDFIDTLEDGHVRELLEVAIHGRGAFGRFKGVLGRYPDVRERWFQFKDERMTHRVMDWLDDQGIAPE